MLVSTIYTFVHGKKTYTLYTHSNPECYATYINRYDSEADVYTTANIDSDKFDNKTVGYIDQHIVEWFDNAEKTPALSID